MRSLNRYKYHLIALLALLALLLLGNHTHVASLEHTVDELPRVEQVFQVDHALELFPQYKASLALLSADHQDERAFIYELVEQQLPFEQKVEAFDVARAVISEANHHHMDPLFLLAVITTESQFDSTRRGSHGEVGVMQILPSTAAWLAPQAGLGANYDLMEPSVNIRLGATYLSSLRRSFKNHGRRYVAAYNMGSSNVRRLVATQVEPEIYPDRVLQNYENIYHTLAKTEPATRGLASIK